jgi:hypothetical protein
MMQKTLLLVAFLLLPVFCWGLEVAEGVVTTAVVERQPVDSLTSVSPQVGQVYCYTRIAGAAEGAEVTHVWSWQGREMARVALPVRSNDWRTWSSKRILPQWTGEWTVAVLDETGVELTAVVFSVE